MGSIFYLDSLYYLYDQLRLALYITLSDLIKTIDDAIGIIIKVLTYIRRSHFSS